MEKENHEMIEDTIHEMIKEIIDVCLPWVKPGKDGLLRFVDPIDHKEISAHYGATHAAAAFIIYGEKCPEKSIADKGYQLLDSIIKRWDKSSNLPEFHNDFNNFALCVLADFLFENHTGNRYIDPIKKIVLSTPDSNNPTVNWIPMRWFVNLTRYKWTKEEKYKTECEKCGRTIKSASFEDGFIDDRIPKGISFNLQYDVSTVAELQFLRCRGEGIDLSKETGALLNAVLPDGDINYFGRGTNQIFAWGPWIYFLASAGLEDELKQALQFCFAKVPEMLQKHNLMLNDWSGAEKYLWWDYHYCSVYTAHFLLWLIMSVKDWHKAPIKPISSKTCDSGFKVIRKDGWVISTFSGRKEYLSERGPIVAAIGREDGKVFLKGMFGPWGTLFGRKYTHKDIILRNYMGLLGATTNKDLSNNRYLRRILHLYQPLPYVKIAPVFTYPIINEDDEKVVILFRDRGKSERWLNIPLIHKNAEMKLVVDGHTEDLHLNISLRNQYDWIYVFQSKQLRGSKWELTIYK